MDSKSEETFGGAKKFFFGEGLPPLAFLLMEVGLDKKKAMIAAAILQVIVILILLYAVWLFYDWKMTFDAIGCKAYCQCVPSIKDMVYLAPQ